MLQAKTAVADGHWARVGWSNLNVSSWFANCELDLIIEDDAFAHEMEEMYLQDLKNATEIILDRKHKVRAPGEPASSAASTRERWRKRKPGCSGRTSHRQRCRSRVHQRPGA